MLEELCSTYSQLSNSFAPTCVCACFNSQSLQLKQSSEKSIPKAPKTPSLLQTVTNTQERVTSSGRNPHVVRELFTHKAQRGEGWVPGLKDPQADLGRALSFPSPAFLLLTSPHDPAHTHIFRTAPIYHLTVSAGQMSRHSITGSAGVALSPWARTSFKLTGCWQPHRLWTQG